MIRILEVPLEDFKQHMWILGGTAIHYKNRLLYHEFNVEWSISTGPMRATVMALESKINIMAAQDVFN